MPDTRFIQRQIANRAAATNRRLATAGRKAAVSPEEIEKWQRLLDPEQTSLQEFIEHYRVSTKETQADGTNQTDIALWPAQLRILEAISEAWESGHAAKLVILKDREQGCSFVIQAILWERFLRGGGGEMRTVSHKDSATEALQMDFESFRQQTPAWVFTELLGCTWERSALGVWKLVWPNHSFSFAETMTCRDGAMGRGNRTRWFHLSEYPWWQTGRGNIGGALTTLRDTPGNIYIFESTGKDFDEFYDLCCGARDETNGWTLLFFSWLTHPLKTATFRGPADRETFKDTIGKLDRYDAKEELEVAKETDWDLGRLKWRRQQIDSPGCNGDVAWFAREHPRFFEQAFYADSDCFFDAQILDSRRKASEREETKCERGVLTWTVSRTRVDVEFNPRMNGPVRLYKRPQKGRRYAFGSDPASGKKTSEGGRRVADWATILVVDIETEDVCLIYRDHIAPEDLAPLVYAVSCWYGWAPGYPERNGDGKTMMYVCSQLDEQWPVPDSPILFQLRKATMGNGSWESEPGFLSDAATKPVACNRLRKFVRNLGMYEKGPSRLPLPLLQEMRLFVRTQTYNKNGQPTGRITLGASSGHDDVISAAWMAWEAREWLLENPDDQREVTEEPIDPTLARLIVEAERMSGDYHPEPSKLWLPHGAKSLSAKGSLDEADIGLGAGF